jgi:hypothetical protein
MSHGPHAIERLDDGSGPRYRLVGPGVTSKWYAGKDQLERLEDLRDLMNYAAQANCVGFRQLRAVLNRAAEMIESVGQPTADGMVGLARQVRAIADQ